MEENWRQLKNISKIQIINVIQSIVADLKDEYPKYKNCYRTRRRKQIAFIFLKTNCHCVPDFLENKHQFWSYKPFYFARQEDYVHRIIWSMDSDHV